MSCSRVSTIKSSEAAHHAPSKLQTYGFAIIIIVGLGGLGVVVTGVAGIYHVGPLSNLAQDHAIIMLVAGGAGGTLCLVLGIAGFLKNSQSNTISEGNQPILSGQTANFATAMSQFNDKKIKKQISGVYTLSNESKIEITIREIEHSNQTKTDKLKCHAGVGALHNFDIMAARLSDYGILFDFNPYNQEFINQCLDCLKTSDSSKAFVEKIIPYMESNLDKYNHYAGYDSPISRMQAELARRSSWLWQEDTSGKFHHIKKLAIEGKIVAITQDFCQTPVFQLLIGALQQFDCCVDTLYLSNLYAFLPQDSFYKTLDILTESHPIVIHCTSPANCHCAHGCQCPKEQHIGKTWIKVSKEQGGIQLK